jgi:VWFA-related protein
MPWWSGDGSERVGRAAVGLLSLGLWVGTAAGWQSGPPKVFPSDVDLVVVDVTVVGANGRPIGGLTQNDFVISEDGNRQDIATFAAVVADEAAVSAGPSGRTIALFLDDLNLTSSQAERVKTGVADFLTNHTTPGDEISLIAPGSGLAERALIPGGRDEMLAAMRRVRSRRFGDGPNQRLSEVEAQRIYKEHDAQTEEQVSRRFVAEDAGLADLGETQVRLLVRGQAAQVFNEAFARTKSTLGAIERVLGSWEGKPGRKQVVLASAGFFYDTSLPELRSIVNAALRVNAAIYFLDARGLKGLAPFQDMEAAAATDVRDLNAVLFEGLQATEGAESLAADTGGFTVRNTNDLAKGFRAIADTSRAYYLIGYHPSAARHDGKFQRIEVALQQAHPGMKVLARRGYFAPKDGFAAAAPSPLVGRNEPPPTAGPSAAQPAILEAVARYRQGDRAVIRETLSLDRLRRDLADLKRRKGTATCDTCEDRRFEPFPFEAAAMLLTDQDALERNSRPGLEEAPPLPAPLLGAARQFLELIPDPERRRRFERPWLLAVALHLFQHGQWPLALSYMDLGLQRYPEDARLLLARGSLLETVGFQQLQLVSPDDVVAAPTQSRRDDAWKQASAGRSLLAQAESCYGRALKANPGLLEARVRLGHVLHRMNQPEKAARELEGVLAEPDANAHLRYLAWLFLGAIREAQGRPTDGVLAYRAAIGLLPESQAAYVALSHALHRVGEREASLEPLRETLGRAGRGHESDPWWVYPWGQSLEVNERLQGLRQEALR